MTTIAEVYEHVDGGFYELLTLDGKIKQMNNKWAGPYVFYRSLRDGKFYATRPERWALRFKYRGKVQGTEWVDRVTEPV